MSRGAKQLGTRTSPNFLAGKKYAAVSDMLSSILIPIHPVDFHLHVLFSSLARTFPITLPVRGFGVSICLGFLHRLPCTLFCVGDLAS